MSAEVRNSKKRSVHQSVVLRGSAAALLIGVIIVGALCFKAAGRQQSNQSGESTSPATNAFPAPPRHHDGQPRRRRARDEQPAKQMVPRGQIRSVHSLGPVRDSRRDVEGAADSRHRRMDHEPRQGSREGVRATGRAVQSGQIQRRRVGAVGSRRGDEIPDDHLETSRRFRDVQVAGQQIQHRRRHAVQPRPAEGASGRMRQTRDQTLLLLLAGAGLARA